MDDTIKSVRSQTQPLVKLTNVSLEVLELSEKEGDVCEESFTVVCSRREDVKDGLKLKLKFEMKEEEELLDNIEAEFVNGDDGK